MSHFSHLSNQFGGNAAQNSFDLRSPLVKPSVNASQQDLETVLVIPNKVDLKAKSGQRTVISDRARLEEIPAGITIDEAGSNELRTTLGSAVDGWERLALSAGMPSRDSSAEGADVLTKDAGGSTGDTLALDQTPDGRLKISELHVSNRKRA